MKETITVLFILALGVAVYRSFKKRTEQEPNNNSEDQSDNHFI